MSAQVRDVSELNAIEAFDKMLDPILIINPEGIIRYVNKAFVETLKFQPEEAIGNHFLDIGLSKGLTKKTQAQARQRFKSAIEKKILHGALYRFDLEERAPIHFLTNTSIVEDSNGETEYAIVIMKDVTGRVIIEDELKRRESDLRVILDSAPAGIWYKDTENNILRVNKSGAASVGLTPSEIEGKATAELFPEHAEKYYQDDLEVIESGESKLGIIEPLITPAGETLWVKTDKIVTRDAAGQINGVIAIVEDITEIKNTQEELEKSQKELSLLVRISDIFGTTSEEVMYAEILEITLDATKSEHGIFGYIDEEGSLVCPSLTRQIWDQCEMDNKSIVFPRDTWGGIWGQSLIEKKTKYSNEPFQVPDGHLPMKRAVNVPIVHNEKLIGNLLVGNKSEDYTDEDVKLIEKIGDHLAPLLNTWIFRKRAEASLIKSEQQFRVVFEQSNIGMTFVNLEDELIDVNDTFAQMLGYTRKELLELAITDFSVPEDHEIDEHFKQKLLNEELTDYSMEKRYIRKDGETIWGRLSVTMVRGEDSVPLFTVGMIEDITKRKQVEEDLSIGERESKLKSELFTSLSFSSSLQDSAELLLHTALKIEGIDSGGIYSRNKENGSLILLYHSGLSDDFVNIISELGPETPQAQLVSLGNPVYAPFETVPGVDNPQMREGLKSIAIVPIKHEDEVLAVLNLASHTHSEIPDRSRVFIESLALQLGEVYKRVVAVSALELSEQNYRLLVEESPVSLWEINFSQVKEAFEKMIESGVKDPAAFLKSSPEEAMKMSSLVKVENVSNSALDVFQAKSKEQLLVGLDPFIPPEAAPAFQGWIMSLLQGQKEYHIETVTLTATGEMKNISLNASVLPGYEESLEKVLVSIADITDRVEAETAVRQLNLELEDRVLARTSELEAERNRAQTYLDISEVVMLALDKDGIITLVNRKGCEVLGCSSEEIIGKNWFDSFIPAESKIEMSKVFSGIMRGELENARYYENAIRTTQNEIRILAWHNTIIKNSSGTIIGTLSSGEDITERKEAEKALRESEQRNRIIVDAMSDLVLVIDSEERYSDYFAKDDSLLVRPWDEMKGRKQEEILPQDIVAHYYGNAKKVRETGESITYEIEIETVGGLRWLQGTMMLHANKVSIVIAIKDITNRKASEVALIESELQFRTVFESTPVGMRVFELMPNDDLILRDINPACEKLLDIDCSNLIGKKIEEAFPSLVETDLPHRIRDVVKKGGIYETEDIYFKIGKISRVFEVKAFKTIENYCVVTFTDISEEKRAREQIADAERRLRLSYDHAAIGMVWENIDGVFLRVNKAFSKLVGYTEEELMGMTFQEVTHPEDREIGDAIMKKLIIGKSDRGAFEKRYIHKNGNVIHVRVNAAFIENDVEGRGYFFTQIEDITDAKVASWALRERMKEVRCLYAVANIAGRSDITVVDLLSEVVEVLPPAWQYPEITCARIQFEEFEITTSNFKDTPWKLSADVSIAGEAVGIIEVCYLEEKQPFEEGPFLKEERDLINAIADRLATNIHRIRTEDALHESQEQLASFIDSATDSILLFDSELNTIMLNNEARNLLAPAIGDMEPLGRHILELSPSIKETGRYDAYRDVVKTGKPFLVEDYIPNPKFGDIYLNLRAFKVGDGLGILTTNVTDRLKIEEALKESEERFRGSFEESPISLEILDSDGIILRVNKACLEMFGVSQPEDLIGFNMFEDPNLPNEHKEQLRNNRSVREDYTFDFELVKNAKLYPTTKSGLLHLRTTFSPLGVTPDGSRAGFLAQIVDVTDRVVAEQKLLTLNAELENIVDKRTKELRETQEELVRAERLTTLGQISGGVGHELRNPLGAIKNATYFLKIMIETPNSEIEETLDILDKEVENCEKIINSLLDYARPTEPVLQKVDIVELIQGVLERIEIPENINVQSKFSKKTPIILGDPHQLERVFLNLISNSIQAMSDGGTLTLRTERKDGNVQVFVQDTGIGIPEDNMKKLFEPLFTTKAKGIGLGLSIVKTLVESHKGEISVESEVGKGTTFMIQLPNPNGRL